MDVIITDVASITVALTTDCTITITTITTTNTVVIIVNTNVSVTKVLLNVDYINVGETHGQGQSTFLCECRRRLAEAWILGVKRLSARPILLVTSTCGNEITPGQKLARSKSLSVRP